MRFVLAGLLASIALGQQFEVASMKPGTGLSLSPRREGDRWAWRGAPLSYLVQYAFDVGLTELAGAIPREMITFDVEARIPTETSDADIRKMLQALLTERMDLKARWEVRETNVLVLTVGPKGHKMKAAQEGSDFRVDGKPIRAGVVAVVLGQDGRHFMAIGVPMAQVARLLGSSLQIPVVDRTGLTGTFDVDVLHTSDDAKADPFLPSLRTAFQETLGLKIESTKAPVRMLVVDSIGKLKEN